MFGGCDVWWSWCLVKVAFGERWCLMDVMLGGMWCLVDVMFGRCSVW